MRFDALYQAGKYTLVSFERGRGGGGYFQFRQFGIFQRRILAGVNRKTINSNHNQ